MKKISLIALLCLAAGMAQATFELEDPSADVYEDMPEKLQEEPASEEGRKDPVRRPKSASVVSSGIGKTACSDFTTNAAERSRMYLSGLYFVQGFIDGAAYQQLRTVGEYGLGSGHEAETIELWIGDYCRENPGENLAQAAGAFVEARS